VLRKNSVVTTDTLIQKLSVQKYKYEI